MKRSSGGGSSRGGAIVETAWDRGRCVDHWLNRKAVR